MVGIEKGMNYSKKILMDNAPTSLEKVFVNTIKANNTVRIQGQNYMFQLLYVGKLLEFPIQILSHHPRDTL